MKIRPNLFHEMQLDGIVAGLDEVGCGPWAGPLVSAAVIFPHVIPAYSNDIDDSKKLTRAKREYLFEHLMADSNLEWGIGLVSVPELDALLLRKALPLSFARAVDALKTKPGHLLIDGIRDPKLPYPTTLLKQGDRLSLSIAAASIIAKVTRDRIMIRLHEEYPDYGWEQNAGYGTKAHQHALATLGVTCHHRRSYAPIKVFLGENHSDFPQNRA